MYARVTQFHILPNKLDSFLAALRDAVPHAHQHGFRALIVLRAEDSVPTADVRVMSLWDSIEDVQAGEQYWLQVVVLTVIAAASKLDVSGGRAEEA